MSELVKTNSRYRRVMESDLTSGREIVKASVGMYFGVGWEQRVCILENVYILMEDPVCEGYVYFTPKKYPNATGGFRPMTEFLEGKKYWDSNDGSSLSYWVLESSLRRRLWTGVMSIFSRRTVENKLIQIGKWNSFRRARVEDLTPGQEIVRAVVGEYRGPGFDPRIEITETVLVLDDVPDSEDYVHFRSGERFHVEEVTKGRKWLGDPVSYWVLKKHIRRK